MRIFGIDPGTASTGYACLDFNGSTFKMVDCGCVRTAAEKPISRRVLEIYTEISCLLDIHLPDVVVIERQFFNQNVTNALLVGHASGVIMLAAAEREIPVEMYTPLQVKQAIAGYGKADKKQIQYMVKNILNLETAPKPDDTADAIAVAICHANISQFKSKIAENLQEK